MTLLNVNHLGVRFQTPDGYVNAVNGVSFALAKGKTLGIVGESGSGKSQTVLATMGLLAKNGEATGEVLFEGKNILTMGVRELNTLRGNRISMIFQDPMTCLNPYLTIERQMTEVLELHQGLRGKGARNRSIEMLERVCIPEAARRIRMYPHEFSGGMRQRVMIAMALLCEPDILLADEPTTALDVTVQAQILGVLKDLQRDLGTAIVLITHDLGVVAGICDHVLVMYGGRIMESAPVDHIFANPTHPYTRGLLEALPRVDVDVETLKSIPGNPPNMARLPKGCPFAERCAFADGICWDTPPPLEPISGSAPGLRACHRAVGTVVGSPGNGGAL